MVVTAVNRASELKKIPVVIKSVDKNIITKNASTNLIDGLKKYSESEPNYLWRAISKPVIRGLGYNRVNHFGRWN